MRSIKTFGQITGVDGPVILATDACVDERRASAGFLATTGHYGAVGHTYDAVISGPQRTEVAELRAVAYGLRRLYNNGVPSETPVDVRIDSPAALGFLHGWVRGSTRMPSDYRSWRTSDNTPTLELLRRLVVSNAATLTFSFEKGHVGHVLNEAADSLAKLGLRCSKGYFASETFPDLARKYADRDLTAYQMAEEKRHL
jgi:ribonuclease HI